MAKVKGRATTKPVKRKSTAAPGSYRGFSFQGTRFLVHLLRAKDGDTVCLEAFEDVAVEHATGKRTSEEDKSYSASNPLSRRAVEFWKTLRNWVDGVNAGDLDAEKTNFVLCAPGCQCSDIATEFHKAQT